METFGHFFRNWFGYTRRERRSTFILLNIIVLIFLLRYLIPGHKISIREIPLNLSEDRIPSKMSINDQPEFIRESNIKQSRSVRQPIDLNSTDSSTLVALPGIGPVLSSRIIKYRNLIGGFASIRQLSEVYGLHEETINMISGRLYADSLLLRKIRINEAGYNDLIRHPYFSKKDISSILKYRQLQGKINTISEMVENNLISAETAVKIRPYLEFGD